MSSFDDDKLRVCGIDFGKDNVQTEWKGFKSKDGTITLTECKQRIIDPLFKHDCDVLLYTFKDYKWTKPTRWQRFKRRWSSRLNRVIGAWGVLRGTKQAVDCEDCF